MAWSEWERVKAASVERQSAQMQLNGVPSDAGSSGTLVSDRPAWAKAGNDVTALRDGMDKARGQLADGQEGLAKQAGCQTSGAQSDVFASWEKYVRKLGDRCAKLGTVLENAGKNELKTEEAIKAQIGTLRAAYADTPAAGRHGK
ncbi:hypothetical protein ACWDCL_03575 [Streptomyces sp. NPDC001009]